MLDEKMKSTLCWIAIGAVVLIVLPYQAILNNTRSWLLQHGFLIPDKDALLPIPGTGTGLDLPRILILIGALAVIIWLAQWIARQAIKNRKPSDKE